MSCLRNTLVGASSGVGEGSGLGGPGSTAGLRARNLSTSLSR